MDESRATPVPERESRHADAFRASVWGLADYVPGRGIQEVASEYGLRAEEVFKLASNENAFGPSPTVKDAICAELGNLHRYAWEEFTTLKQCLAEANGVDPANIVVSAGSGPLVEVLPLLYTQPGDEVISSAQTYSRYASCSAAAGAIVREVPLKKYCFDLPSVLRLVNPRTKIVWLCNPNNPTGTILRTLEVEQFLDALPRTVAVVLDQAYCEFTDADDFADGVTYLQDGHDNVIVLRTFSKAYGLAGLRLGYAIADELVCRMLERISEPFSISRLAAAAGPAALEDREWRDEVIQAVRAGREHLAISLENLGCHAVPSHANFLLVDVGCDASDLAHRLMKRGVIVRPADGWGYLNHIRVTIGTDRENAAFLDAIEQALRVTTAGSGPAPRPSVETAITGDSL